MVKASTIKFIRLYEHQPGYRNEKVIPRLIPPVATNVYGRVNNPYLA